MKKYWRVILSLVLLMAGRLLMMLFVSYFTALTGELGLGYTLGSILFGSLASLPVALPILRKPGMVGRKTLAIFALVCLYAGILFLSSLSIGPRTRPDSMAKVATYFI